MVFKMQLLHFHFISHHYHTLWCCAFERNATLVATVHDVRPDDPMLSCYIRSDGLWECVRDADMTLDPDASY